MKFHLYMYSYTNIPESQSTSIPTYLISVFLLLIILPTLSNSSQVLNCRLTLPLPPLPHLRPKQGEMYFGYLQAYIRFNFSKTLTKFSSNSIMYPPPIPFLPTDNSKHEIKIKLNKNIAYRIVAEFQIVSLGSASKLRLNGVRHV